jgi:hypothetical protein
MKFWRYNLASHEIDLSEKKQEEILGLNWLHNDAGVLHGRF